MTSKKQLAVYVDAETHRRFHAAAAARGSTVSHVLKENIDRVLSDIEPDRQAPPYADARDYGQLERDVRWLVFAARAQLKYHPTNDLLPVVVQAYRDATGETPREA